MLEWKKNREDWEMTVYGTFPCDTETWLQDDDASLWEVARARVQSEPRIQVQREEAARQEAASRAREAAPLDSSSGKSISDRTVCVFTYDYDTKRLEWKPPAETSQKTQSGS